MSEYEVRKWYGWNGGECPVHPETVVEIVAFDCEDEGHAKVGIRPARYMNWDWGFVGMPVIAFRVITPYIEPREFWAKQIEWVGFDCSRMEWTECDKDISGAVLFREVI